MKKRFAEDLAKEREMESREEYFDYIVESVVNGQRQQAKNLFSEMHNDDQHHFLTSHIDTTPGQIGKSVLNICLDTLIK